MEKEIIIDLKNLSDKYPKYVFYAFSRDLKLVDFISKNNME